MDWWECGDIKIYTDAGDVMYSGPKFVRCTEYGCQEIVTDGQIREHGACACGNKRYRSCRKLTETERKGMLNGAYLLSEWEYQMIFGEDNVYIDPPAKKERPKIKRPMARQ